MKIIFIISLTFKFCSIESKMNTFVVVLLASLAFASASILNDERIAGGVDSKPGEQPSFVYLTVLFEEKTQNCGGVLIKPNYVLTAASCVKE